MPKNKKLIYKSDIPQRLDKFLASQLLGYSRADIQRLIKQGSLKVNEKIEHKLSRKLKQGDSLVLSFNPSSKLRASLPDLTVRYEHSDFLAVEKPAGLPVYETKKAKTGSLIDLVISRYPEIKKIGEPERPGIVHRLDKQTSGLLLVARTQAGFHFLKNLFKNRQIEKYYQALVYGNVSKRGDITSSLSKIGQDGRTKVRIDDEKGRPSLTEYWLNRSYRDSRGLDEYSLIEIKLHTGRTHQIRVHFASIGHPVMGDTLYGKPKSQLLKDILPRQFLHAKRLVFQSIDGTWLEIESKLPIDLQKALKHLDKLSI